MSAAKVPPPLPPSLPAKTLAPRLKRRIVVILALLLVLVVRIEWQGVLAMAFSFGTLAWLIYCTNHSVVRIPWQSVVVLNLALFVFLCFICCTNHSLPGYIPNLIFPLAVGVFAFVSLLRRDKGPTQWTEWIYKLSCIPSLVGGGIGVFILIVLVATMGGAFILQDILSGNQAQCLVSPSHLRIAVVYGRVTGNATTSGGTDITICVRHRFLPFVERNVYRFCTWRIKNTAGYVRWKDNNTIEIIGEPDDHRIVQRELRIPPVTWKLSKSLFPKYGELSQK